MRHIRYFLIEPKDVARQSLPSRAGEQSLLLLEPLLTSRSVGDKSNWLEIDQLLAVKLSFLAMLREYSFLASPEAAIAILGSDQVAEELFDQWWSIRPLQLEEPSEHMQVHLAAVIDQTPKTRSAVVNEWLATTFRNPINTAQ